MKPHEFVAKVLGIAPSYAQKILGGYCRPEPNEETAALAKAIAKDYAHELELLKTKLRKKYR